MEEIRTKPDTHTVIEPHFDEAIMEKDGFFRRAVTATGLWSFVTAKPSRMLTIAVAELLLNLREGELSTRFIDPSTSSSVTVSLVDIANVFSLPADGEVDLMKVDLSYNDEFRRFSIRENTELNKRGNNIREDLLKPFNLIGELFIKSIACHIGGFNGITDTKIKAITAIVDSMIGLKFNWQNWFI